MQDEIPICGFVDPNGSICTKPAQFMVMSVPATPQSAYDEVCPEHLAATADSFGIAHVATMAALSEHLKAKQSKQ